VYLSDTALRIGAVLTDVQVMDAVRVDFKPGSQSLRAVDRDGYELSDDGEATEVLVPEAERDCMVCDETDAQGWPYTSFTLLSQRAVDACEIVK